MSAGQIQLASKGVQDEVLTANPSITYFKTKFAKQQEFSIKTKQIPFVNTNILFGAFQTCDIKAHGDIIRSIIIKTTLPSLFQPTYNYSYPVLSTSFNPKLSYLDIDYNPLYTYTTSDILIYYTTADLSWLPSIATLVNNTFQFRTIDERVVYIGFETLEFAIFWGFKSFINFKNGLYIFRFSTSAQFDIITSGWVNSYFPYFRYYTPYAGVNIIKSVDLLVGGQVIETIPSKYIMIYNDIYVPEHQQQSVSNLFSSTFTNSISPVDYYLKIPFSIKNIPISTLYRQDVKINVTFGNFTDILDSNALNVTQFSNITNPQTATANVSVFDGVSTFLVADSNIFSYKQFISQPVLKKQLVKGLYNSSAFDGRYMYLQADPFFQRYDTVTDKLDTYNIDNITGVSNSVGVSSTVSFSNNSAQVLTNSSYFKNTFIPCSNISYVQTLSSTTCAVVNDVNIFIFDTVPTNMNSYKPYAYTRGQIPIQFTTFNSVIYYLSSSFVQTLDRTIKISLPMGRPISIHNLNSILYVLYSDGKLYNLVNSTFVLATRQPPVGDTILQARSLYYNFQYLIVYVTSANRIKYFQVDTGSNGTLVLSDSGPFSDLYLGVFEESSSLAPGSYLYFCTKSKMYIINAIQNIPSRSDITFVRAFSDKVFIMRDNTNTYAIGDHVEYVLNTTISTGSALVLNPIRFTPTPMCNLVSFDGTYVYICPTNGNSNIIMYNTQIPFLSNSAYSFVTVRNPYNSLTTNRVHTGTAISDGTYMYIWPKQPDSNVSLIDKTGDVSTYDIGSTAPTRWGRTSNSYSSLFLNGIFYITTDVHVKKFDTSQNPAGFGSDPTTLTSLNSGTFCFNNSTFVFFNNGTIREYDNSTISSTLITKATYSTPANFINSPYYMIRNGTTSIVYMIPTSGSSGSVYSYDLSKITDATPTATCGSVEGINSRTACVYNGFLYIFPSAGSTDVIRIAQTASGTASTFTKIKCPGVNFVSATVYESFILLTDDRSIMYRFNPTLNIFNDECAFFKNITNPMSTITGRPFIQNSNIYIVSQNSTLSYNVQTGTTVPSPCSFTQTPIATTYGVSNIVVADGSNLHFTTSLQSCIYDRSVLTTVYNRPITAITADISNVYIQFDDNRMGVLDLASSDFTGVGYFVSSVNSSGIPGNFVGTRNTVFNTLYSIEPGTLRQYTASTLAQVGTLSSPGIIGGITTNTNFYPLYGPSVSTINRLQIQTGAIALSYTGVTIPLTLSINTMTGYGGATDAYFASRSSNILLRYNETAPATLRTYSNLIIGNTFSNITQIDQKIYFLPYSSNTVVVYDDPVNTNFDGTLNLTVSQPGSRISLLPKVYDDATFLSADGGFYSSFYDQQIPPPNNPPLIGQQIVYYQFPVGINLGAFYNATYSVLHTSRVNQFLNFSTSTSKPSGFIYMHRFYKYKDNINIILPQTAGIFAYLYDTNGNLIYGRNGFINLLDQGDGAPYTVDAGFNVTAGSRVNEYAITRSVNGTYTLSFIYFPDRINIPIRINGYNLSNYLKYSTDSSTSLTFTKRYFYEIYPTACSINIKFDYSIFGRFIQYNYSGTVNQTIQYSNSIRSFTITNTDNQGTISRWIVEVIQISPAINGVFIKPDRTFSGDGAAGARYTNISCKINNSAFPKSTPDILGVNYNTDQTGFSGIQIDEFIDTSCLGLTMFRGSLSPYTQVNPQNVNEYFLITNDQNWNPDPSFVYPFSTNVPYPISNVVTSGISSVNYYFPIVVNQLIPDVKAAYLGTQDGLYYYRSSSTGYTQIPLNINYTGLGITPNVNYRFNKIGFSAFGLCFFGPREVIRFDGSDYDTFIFLFIYPQRSFYNFVSFEDFNVGDTSAYIYYMLRDYSYWYFILVYPTVGTCSVYYCTRNHNTVLNGSQLSFPNSIYVDKSPILIVEELERGFLFVQSNFTILWVDGEQNTFYEIGTGLSSVTIQNIGYTTVNNIVYIYGSGTTSSSTSGALFIATVDITNISSSTRATYTTDISGSIDVVTGTTRKFTNAVYDGSQYLLFFTNQPFGQSASTKGIITCDTRINPPSFSTQAIYNNRLPVTSFASSNVAVSLASPSTQYIRVYGPSLSYVDITPLSYNPPPMSLYRHQEQLMFSNASCTYDNTIWMFPGFGSTSNKIVKFNTINKQFSYDPTTTPDIIGAVTFQNRVVSINVSSLTIYQTATPQVSVVNIPGGGVTSFAAEPQYLSVTGRTGVYHMNCITGVLNKSYFLSNIQHSVMTYNSNVFFSNAFRTSSYRTDVKPFNLYSITQSVLTNNTTSVFGMSSTGTLNIFNKTSRTSRTINTGLINPVFSANIYSNAYFLSATGTVYSPFTTQTTFNTGLSGASQIVSDFASNLFVTTTSGTMARTNIQLTGTVEVSTKSLVTTGSSFYAGTNLYSITSDSFFGTYNGISTPFFSSSILKDSNLYTSITVNTKIYLFPGNVFSKNMFILDTTKPFNQLGSYTQQRIVSDSNVMALRYDSGNSKIYGLTPTNLLIYDIQDNKFSNLAFTAQNIIIRGVRSIDINPRSLAYVDNTTFKSIFFRKFIGDNYFQPFLFFPNSALPSKVYKMISDGRYIYTMSNIVYKIDTFSSSTNIDTVLRPRLVSSSGYFDGRYVNLISNTHIIHDTIPLTIPTTFLTSSIVTYAYLNKEDKEWLRSYILDYPISQIQTTTFVTNSLDGFFSVDFKGPIKEVLIQTTGGVLTNLSVFFNGNLKHKSSNNYLSNVAFNSYHTRSPTINTNLYSWSLSSHPEDNNPNGYVNMGRISEKVFNIQVSNPQTTVTMYGLVHNIVRVKDGLGGLVFNNYI